MRRAQHHWRWRFESAISVLKALDVEFSGGITGSPTASRTGGQTRTTHDCRTKRAYVKSLYIGCASIIKNQTCQSDAAPC